MAVTKKGRTAKQNNEVHSGTAVTIASSECGDWEVLYVNGEKRSEGHSLRLDDVLDVLGIKVTQREISDLWLEKNGCFFPKLESDLPKK
jgi:hypothetical protein